VNIGKFYLNRRNDGKWEISYSPAKQTARITVIHDNLEADIERIVELHREGDRLSNLFVRVFELYFINPEAFLDEPAGKAILNNLTDTDVIPGFFDKDRRFDWHTERLLLGFNRAYKTNWTMQDISQSIQHVKAKYQ
jgi:hypothetical protein